jgi:hypothetical protein
MKWAFTELFALELDVVLPHHRQLLLGRLRV